VATLVELVTVFDPADGITLQLVPLPGYADTSAALADGHATKCPSPAEIMD
jgi:hypothetical protein